MEHEIILYIERERENYSRNVEPHYEFIIKLIKGIVTIASSTNAGLFKCVYKRGRNRQ